MIFWNFCLDQISPVVLSLLSCYILGAEGLHFGNVPVENKANWPIFIHAVRSHYTAPA